MFCGDFKELARVVCGLDAGMNTSYIVHDAIPELCNRGIVVISESSVPDGSTSFPSWKKIHVPVLTNLGKFLAGVLRLDSNEQLMVIRFVERVVDAHGDLDMAGIHGCDEVA